MSIRSRECVSEILLKKNHTCALYINNLCKLDKIERICQFLLINLVFGIEVDGKREGFYLHTPVFGLLQLIYLNNINNNDKNDR